MEIKFVFCCLNKFVFLIYTIKNIIYFQIVCLEDQLCHNLSSKLIQNGMGKKITKTICFAENGKQIQF